MTAPGGLGSEPCSLQSPFSALAPGAQWAGGSGSLHSEVLWAPGSEPAGSSSVTTLLKSSSRAQAGSGPEGRGTRDEGRPHTRLRGGANAPGPQRPAAAAAAPSLGRSLSALSCPPGRRRTRQASLGPRVTLPDAHCCPGRDPPWSRSDLSGVTAQPGTRNHQARTRV